MLLIDQAGLARRRAILRGPLEALHHSLCDELTAVIAARPDVPRVKALLSRAGGRCEDDGVLLDFDPRSPHAHRCPRCGRIHEGELHHRAWVTSFQLWLAERCVHAALFALLDGSEAHRAFAADALREYAEWYARYPNRDNVLGPTRLFFSTYLESIWLLQICVAAGFLEQAGDKATADIVRDRIIAPSSTLIAEYDEGMSNRQVWNNAALLAAAQMLGDVAGADRIVSGSSGVESHLTHALLGDGTWYEGENYHQFALRGLWYGVVLAEAGGHRFRDEMSRRFDSAFIAPFLTALPDFTLPSRKDSQYAVSLRQWRIAETTELGFARSGDVRLAAALARCYEPGEARRDTGRSRSTADVERNAPASRLTRADLGWRALVFAVPELPDVRVAPQRSALLEEQGIAVFRREHDAYVALDYGQSGGGHGHPDRLNVMMAIGARRVLDDLGTGSYVDPSLHWYRSTLAHNAPMVGGRSQPLHDGVLHAYDEREGLGWAVATFDNRSDVQLERAIVVAPDYIVDELRWRAAEPVRIEIPWHVNVVSSLALSPDVLDGGDGLEDGFEFVRDVSSAPLPAHEQLDASGPVHLASCSDVELRIFRGVAPGQPASKMQPFWLMRAHSAQGRIRTILSWADLRPLTTFDAEAITIQMADGERHVHRRDDTGWHVGLFAGGARSSVDLAGFRSTRDVVAAPTAAAARPAPVVVQRTPDVPSWFTADPDYFRSRAVVRRLAEKHYRRSEDNWAVAGQPRAEVAIAATHDALLVFADIRAGDLRFADAAAQNTYDNEHADTMGAGVQLYARTPDGSGAWSVVPESPGGRVRVRPIIGWGALPAPRGSWRPSASGYELRLELPLPVAGADEHPVDLDLLINETTADRERRRGQLVLSGAEGEFVYLRGDRHDSARLVPFLVVA